MLWPPTCRSSSLGWWRTLGESQRDAQGAYRNLKLDEDRIKWDPLERDRCAVLIWELRFRLQPVGVGRRDTGGRSVSPQATEQGESEGRQVRLCRLLGEVEKRPLYPFPHHMWCLQEWRNRRRLPRYHHLPWRYQHVPCRRLLPQHRSSEVPVGPSLGPYTPMTSPGVHLRLKGCRVISSFASSHRERVPGLLPSSCLQQMIKRSFGEKVHQQIRCWKQRLDGVLVGRVFCSCEVYAREGKGRWLAGLNVLLRACPGSFFQQKGT